MLRCVYAGQRNFATQHSAGSVGLDQVRTKFITEPQIAFVVLAERFDIKIGAGQQTAEFDRGIHRCVGCVIVVPGVIRLNGHGKLVVDVIQGDARGFGQPGERCAAVQVGGIDGAAATFYGSEIRFHAVHPQQGVGGIALGAKAVVGHHPEAAVNAVQHGRKTLHRLQVGIGRQVGAVIIGRGKLA